ncbi:MAG: DUF1638 domain-containing protein [Parvularculaceae bacterium]
MFARAEHDQAGPSCLVVACGALAKEIVALRDSLGLSEDRFSLQCLPAGFHNTPQKIAPAVEEILQQRAADYDRIFVAYGECGAGGALDAVLERYGASRLDGAHCYEFFAGAALFNDIIENEIGSFFLTDYLVKNFDRLVIKGLGLDRFPHLMDDYFGNYRNLVYLAQTEDARLMEAGAAAAERLGLQYVYRFVGYGELAGAIKALGDVGGRPSHVCG